MLTCTDDDNVDIGRTTDRIINGVFHHPVLKDHGEDGAEDGRRLMFGVVERWWSEQSDRQRDDLRDKLTREGVEDGRNHKEGVEDSGHGCCKPLGMPNIKSQQYSGAIGGVLSGINETLGGNNTGGRQKNEAANKFGDSVREAMGGGALGSVIGGLAGAVGAGLLGGAFSGEQAEKKTYKRESYDGDSQTSQITETGYRPGGYGQEERYGQATVSQTQYSSGGYREEYKRFEQDGRTGNTGYGFKQTTEVTPSPGGGYEQRIEQRYEHPGGRYEEESHVQRVGSSGRRYNVDQQSRSGYKQKDGSDDDTNDDDDSNDEEKKEKKRRKKEKKQREEEEERGSYGGGRRSGSGDSRKDKSRSRSRERHGSGERRGSGDRSYEEFSYQQESSYEQRPTYSRRQHSGGFYDGDSNSQQPSYGNYERGSNDEYGGGNYQGGGNDEYGRGGNDGYSANGAYGEQGQYGEQRRH